MSSPECVAKTENKPFVFFINPPGPANLYRSIVCTYISKANYLWQPIDFVSLSAQIPDEYDIKLIDCSIHNVSQNALFEEIKASKPVLSIISLSSIVYDDDLCFLKDLKHNFPDMKCLVLGDFLLEETFWDKVLEHADGFILNSLDVDLRNYIINNEAHSPNLVLKNTIEQKKAERKPHVKPKMVSIGLARHESFLDEKYRFPFAKTCLYSTVSNQFGCPFQCKYCSNSKIPVVYRDYLEVIAEIEKVVSLGINEIFMGDPSFGYPKGNAKQLLEAIIARNIPISWSCYAIPSLLDDEMLGLMKEAGCHTTIIGVDDEDTEKLKKEYNRNVPAEKLFEFSKNCIKHNIQICGNFIIGLNSDKAAVERIVKFAIKLKLDYASFNIFTVLLGSKVREELIDQGEFDPNTTGYDTSGTYGIKGRTDLIKLRNMAIRKFYMRPAYLWRRISKIRNFTELKIQFGEMLALFKNALTSN